MTFLIISKNWSGSKIQFSANDWNVYFCVLLL